MHPYHNSLVIEEIKAVELEIRQVRREVEALKIARIKPLKDKIARLRAKRVKELSDHDQSA